MALLVWRQPSVRRAALRAVPLVLGGAPLWQVGAFLLARALGERPHEPVVISSVSRPPDPGCRATPAQAVLGS